MPEFYFARFPRVTYNDTVCVNITKNVTLANNVRAESIVFHPYEIKEGLRADVVSYAYYKDSYLEWLIYLTNGIIDPYYDWYLTEEDFNQFLIKKYGSVEESQRRIRHYAIDWVDDTTEITVEHYTNVLPEALKKYYSPVFGNGSSVLSYKRNNKDWIANTNRIMRLEVTMNSNTEFSNNELVVFKNNANTVVGNGEIIVANTSVVKIQHISGNTSANNKLVGLTSNANANVNNSDVVIEVISNTEFVYWEPVYYYDWERNKNEQNKHIYLIDSNYTLPIVEAFRQTLADIQ